LVQGSCDSPSFTHDFNEKELTVYFDQDCIQQMISGNWFKLGSRQGENIDLKPEPLQTKFNPMNTIPLEEKPNLIKSPWFWVAVGTIAAASIHFYNKSKEENEPATSTAPVHRQGN
jgi:hypothetical protein